MLQARLDALSNEERGLLQRASVVGRVFWDDAVDRLGRRRGVPGDAAVSDTLDRLRGRELVFQREVSAFDSAREFLFKHALLRDVAYDSVLRGHRQRYHAPAAAWLAEVSAAAAAQDEYAALIAEHYEQGPRPGRRPRGTSRRPAGASVYALAEADPAAPSRARAGHRRPGAALRRAAGAGAALDRIGDRARQNAELDAMAASPRSTTRHARGQAGGAVGLRVPSRRLLRGGHLAWTTSAGRRARAAGPWPRRALGSGKA